MVERMEEGDRMVVHMVVRARSLLGRHLLQAQLHGRLVRLVVRVVRVLGLQGLRFRRAWLGRISMLRIHRRAMGAMDRGWIVSRSGRGRSHRLHCWRRCMADKHATYRGDPRGGGGSGLGGGGGSAAGSGSVRSSRRSGRDRYAVPESPDED
jgi:uncharacterized membrane protein YgcG